jgi:hypothetical protein
LAQVFVDVGDGIDVSVLNDVGCVNAGLQAPVEAQLHHPPKAGPILGEKLV